MFFCGEATKKTSIDGFKWRDFVMGRWWLVMVNFVVSAVRCHKGFHVLNSARQSSPCKRARGQLIPPQSYSISRNNSRSIARAARMKVTNQLYLHIRAHKT